jgi:hypothetical protein
MSWLSGAIAIFLGLVYSILPSAIASKRRHPRRRLIYFLNFVAIFAGPIAGEFGAPSAFGDVGGPNIVSVICLTAGMLILIAWASRSKPEVLAH